MRPGPARYATPCRAEEANGHFGEAEILQFSKAHDVQLFRQFGRIEMAKEGFVGGCYACVQRCEIRASNWGLNGLIAGGILLSPVIGFLMALVVDILIGLLKDSGVPTLLALVVAGAIGGFLFRTLWPRPQGSPSVGM